VEKFINRAMLLAAGLGTRLRPLTFSTPKPLIDIGGVGLIEHQLAYLASHGISEVIVNLHHLGRQITDRVGDGSRFGLLVRYSKEPRILGTGGGIKKAEGFFKGEPFVALNSDALIDADVKALIEAHLESSSVATMVVKELTGGDPYNPVEIDEDGAVRGFSSGRHFYTGLQILGKEMLDALPPAGSPACLIKDGYEKIIGAGLPVKSFLHRGYFNDLGTFERLEKARADVASGAFKLSENQAP